jgi:hypothetical protein
MIWVVRRAMKRNMATEVYIGSRVTESGRPWMEHILNQLDDPLGSAVTLAALLSSNVKQ